MSALPLGVQERCRVVRRVGSCSCCCVLGVLLLGNSSRHLLLCLKLCHGVSHVAKRHTFRESSQYGVVSPTKTPMMHSDVQSRYYAVLKLLYYTLPHYTIFYQTVLISTVLYYTILTYTLPYNSILCYFLCKCIT